MRLIAIVGFCLTLFAPARAWAVGQTVEAARPGGQLVVAISGNTLVVSDTRADDPGWNVFGVDAVATVTAPFADGSGVRYAQHVSLRDQSASAPARHGLGVATLVTSARVVTITVI